MLVRVQYPETEESLTVHGVPLAFSSPPVRDEKESFVSFDSPCRSFSNASLRDLFGDGNTEKLRLPIHTSVHYPTPRPGSLHFLDQPRV